MASKGKFTFATEYNDSADEDPLIICDSQLVSNCLTNSSEDNIQYEMNSGVQYRIVESTTNNLSQPLIRQTGNKTTTCTQLAPNYGAIPTNTDSDMILLNEFQPNRPCTIYPKSTVLSSSQPGKALIMGSSRKRDEARRATHNEVERRRRDKINHWIERIKVLLPEEVTSSEKQHTSRNANDSKSAILIRACEYIKNMQEELENLKMCLSDFEEIVNFREENIFLRSENELLHVENDRLKEMLSIDDKNNIMKIKTTST